MVQIAVLRDFEESDVGELFGGAGGVRVGLVGAHFDGQAR